MEWILGKLIAAPVIGAILGPIINGLLTAQKQKLDAAGSHEAVVADLAKKTIDLDAREAQINAEVVKAEQGNWVTRSIRPLLALPVIIIMWKLIVWDKAFGTWTHGHTDPLSPEMWWFCTTVTIAYMGGRSAEKIADKISGIWKK